MSSESQLQDLLDQWEEDRDKGRARSPEEMCADCPELLADFKKQVEALQSMDFLLQTTTLTNANTAQANKEAVTTMRIGDELSVDMRYASLRFHARGGLGAVYVAGDQTLHREVAIKFIHERHLDDEDQKARFVREAEITGRLEHPGIVPVHGLGKTENGRPFYSMRFIRGETLESAIKRHHKPDEEPREMQRALEFRNLLNRFVSVCNTVAYSHNRGIIHRDIKPENVMLGKYGETLLVDWGLAMPVGRDQRARASGEKTLLPRSGSDSGDSSGSGAGTPAYMSPEQADARLDLTPASDVYSLGSTLYKILTGDTPYQGGHPLEIMGKVRQGDFLPPSRLHRNVSKPLEAICLKAMAFAPAERYHSALELAVDVEHWLADEQVAAYREPWRQRLSRWGRHHKTAVQAGIGGLIALILVASFASIRLGTLRGREREAREHGLILAARFAARTVANEIDLRWRILELEAKDPVLQQLLQRLEVDPDDMTARAQLHDWLEKAYHRNSKTARASNWIVDDARGTMQAVYGADWTEEKMRTVPGQNFAFRDYFHGQGRDLTPAEAKGVKPISDVHRSNVFLGRFDKKLKVAFSVPVQSPEKTLGVLVMTVELGEFAVLQTELGPNQLAVLVDTDADYIDGPEAHGLVLHHRQMREDHLNGLDRLYRLKPPQVDKLRRLRVIRKRLVDDATGATSDHSLSLDSEFQDATEGEFAGLWLAAYEPVIIRGRPDPIRDTGWVVIVQERE